MPRTKVGVALSWHVSGNVKKHAVVVPGFKEDKMKPLTFKWELAADALPIVDHSR